MRAEGRGYLFGLELKWSESEADGANDAFGGELKDEDGVVLKLESTELLKLNILTGLVSEPKNFKFQQGT